VSVEQKSNSSSFDLDAYNRARKEADSRVPIPKDTPQMAAIKYGGAALLTFACFEIFLPVLGLWWAQAFTIGIAALIGWIDKRNEHRANDEMFKILFESYRKDR
jgi:hypothetical protein